MDFVLQKYALYVKKSTFQGRGVNLVQKNCDKSKIISLLNIICVANLYKLLSKIQVRKEITMKGALKTLVIVLVLICTLGLFSANKSEANVKTSLEITSEKSDLFYIIRVVENGKRFICVFLNNGFMISKIEEL